MEASAIAQRLKTLLGYHQYLVDKNIDKEEMDRVAEEIQQLYLELEECNASGQIAGLFE